jgi:integrase
MATFRKRSDGWQARIRRTGYPDLTKTFKTHSDAVAWARLTESDMDRGIFINRSESENTTLAELLTRYLNEITPNKKSQKPEFYRIQGWLKSPLAKRFICTLRSSDFAAWRDSRLKQGRAGNTVKQELAVISHLFFIARAEWGFEGLDNPIRYIRKPKLARGRTRRVTDDEIKLLIENTDSYDLPFMLQLAVETGMRRGEIATIKWSDIYMERRVIQLWDTKNGEDRLVPLSTKAVEVLQRIPKRIDGRLFGMTAHAISYAFIRACKRVKLEDLHFHDLRHEAITRLFEKGFNVMEVGSISGHKTLQMLKRYTHLRAENFLERLG